AILFRSLRVLFARDSAVFSQPGLSRYHGLVHSLLDRVEDVYDPSLPNLDAFRVHYVLNMFNGVEESFNTAVVPMVEALTRNVSGRLNMTHLGWVVQD